MGASGETLGRGVLRQGPGEPAREREGTRPSGPPAARGDEPPPVGFLALLATFFRVGLGSFSLAALGEAKDQVTRKRSWFTDEEFMQGLGLAQLMPGAPTVNLMGYLGYRLRGLPGATVATVAFLVPCFSLMLLLSHLYLRHGGMPLVAGLFRGLAALVVGLVANTLLRLWRSGVKTPFEWCMAVAGLACVAATHAGIFGVLVVAGSASLAAALLARRSPVIHRLTSPPAAKPAPASSGARAAAGPEPEAGSSACSRAPLRTGRRDLAALAAWLLVALAVDLAVLHLRPDLEQMGTRFLRIGALVLGSGYAMLPFIQDAVVNAHRWLTDREFAVALALSLVTPGPVTIIGVFIGYKVAGFAGALTGLVNMYFGSWAMTLLVAAPYARAGRLTLVRSVTRGVVAAFVGTLALVLFRLGRDTLVDLPAVAMAASAFALQRSGKLDTIWIVLAGAVASLVLFR